MLELLQELLNTKEDKRKPYIDKICKLLFMREGAKHPGGTYGVFQADSTIANAKGEKLKLSFNDDNPHSEYVLASLSSLGIEKGSGLCNELFMLYKEHRVKSAIELTFVQKHGKTVLRGVSLGTNIDERSLRFIGDLKANLAAEFKKAKK